VEQIEPHVEHLVLAARQLELGENDVVKALHNAWEETDERPLHRRQRTR
jgi:hypothetical protein